MRLQQIAINKQIYYFLANIEMIFLKKMILLTKLNLNTANEDLFVF